MPNFESPPDRSLRSPPANVIEFGNRFGGSTAFLALLLRPRKLVSVDLEPVVPPELTAFLERAIERNPDALARIAADPDRALPPTPMSRLLLEVVLGAGSERDVFPHVELVQGWAAVERGTAVLDPARFDVAACLGPLARRMLGDA